MPVSTSVHVNHCLDLIIRTNPASVLDIGSGFGLWGFLSRMYLDVFNGRVWPDQWTVKIEGVELFEPYIQAHQRHLYNTIHIGDACEVIAGLPDFDLIIAGDVIEHLDKPRGKALFDALYLKAKKALMVNIPLGDGWEHPEAYGNPGELHRSQWYANDFAEYPHFHQAFRLPCGDYGVFFFPREVSAQESDDMKEAIIAASTDVLLRAGQTGEAVQLLSTHVAANQSAFRMAILLARLLIALRKPSDAAIWLQQILARVDAPEAIRSEAASMLENSM